MQVVGRVEHRLDRGEDDRPILGLAAGHHRVHQHLLDRDPPPPDGLDGEHFVRRSPARLDEGGDQRFRRGHNREAIRPAALEIFLDDRVGIVERQPLRGEVGGHRALLPAL